MIGVENTLTLAGLAYAAGVASVFSNWNQDHYDRPRPNIAWAALVIAIIAIGFTVSRLVAPIHELAGSLAAFAVALGIWPAIIGNSSRQRWAARYATASLLLSALIVILTLAQ